MTNFEPQLLVSLELREAIENAMRFAHQQTALEAELADIAAPSEFSVSSSASYRYVESQGDLDVVLQLDPWQEIGDRPLVAAISENQKDSPVKTIYVFPDGACWTARDPSRPLVDRANFRMHCRPSSQEDLARATEMIGIFRRSVFAGSD